MPTAVDYEVWRTYLDGRADEMSGLLTSALGAATPDALAGGLLAVTVDVTLRASLENANTTAARLRELADECEARAAVCREYDAAMLEYERRMGQYESEMSAYADRTVDSTNYAVPPPRAPSMPVRPAPWVDRLPR